ncbi:DUF6879 family protein [Actinomadura rudentiformis]|uniref:DUF6879 domain-containing protein n=1 Tax=Actinomadura rudentiformis TaxID=359158 RepID=A0A6H9YJJ2_9ACTN|nr:DUF6879 family protein [Actinomadura rudentiformis]KAB2342931.1 hypothetical protein F8566_35795 [Actinomadura rudentiformis]
MELISVEQRTALIWAGRPFLKLELRDSYAFDAGLFDAWRRGDRETISRSVDTWRDKVASEVAAGRRLRRVRVVSEPLSEYQRMAVDISGSAVDAGEELRWLPRRLVSTSADQTGSALRWPTYKAAMTCRGASPWWEASTLP